MDGPIADLEVDSGLELYNKAMEFASDGRKRKHQLSFSQEVDFEHLNDEIDDDDDDDDEGDDDDDDDDEIEDKPISPDDPDAVKKRRERRERQRQKFLITKKKRELKKMAQLKKIRQDGEPVLLTKKAPKAGWYRMCVQSSWNQVSEIEEYPCGISLKVFCFEDKKIPVVVLVLVAGNNSCIFPILGCC